MSNASERVTKYQKENTIQYSFRLNKTTDAELVDVMSRIDNKADFFKKLIREYAEKQKRAII